MIKGLARLLLLRVLPRRLLPVLTVWEAVQVVRGVRRRRADRANASSTGTTRATTGAATTGATTGGPTTSRPSAPGGLTSGSSQRPRRG